MNKIIRSPIVRISFGLALLTSCILLTSDFLGFFPDQKKSELQFRKVIVESLAVQFVSGIIPDRMDVADGLLHTLVDRNDHVISAAVRRDDNVLIKQSGNHEKHWRLRPHEKSTATHIQVPIHVDGKQWGTLEVCFTALGKNTVFFFESIYRLVLFVALVGFISYFLFLKRVMLELDPSSVIPERVGNALNTLSEGLLILDEKSYIIFSNEFFLQRTGLPKKILVGKHISELEWSHSNEENEADGLPWDSVFNGNRTAKDVELRLQPHLGESVLFKVGVSSIGSSAEAIKGVLVTFNDVTELEIKNKALSRALGQLKQGQQEIARQNKELKILATRDSLTGCLNRRSFFDGLKVLLRETKDYGGQISCIMLDIDHFKSVNDNYGHAVGDKVIKMVVKSLMDVLRPHDLIGRYGGEEFCVVLPNADADAAVEIAERMRIAIRNAKALTPKGELKVTSSFGVANLVNHAIIDAESFVDQADKALYIAKESGRDRVELWSGVDDLKSEVQTGVLQEESPAECDVTVDVAGCFEMNGCVDIKSTHHEISDSLLMYDRILQAIERARRNKGKIALLIFDASEIWRVNNVMGSSAGEKFTKLIAKKLAETLRQIDSVGVAEASGFSFSLSQINSDEIAVLLTDFDHDELVVRVAKRIFSVFEEPSFVDGNELYLNVSVGASVYPVDGDDPDSLIGGASGAMREAKQCNGRHNLRFASVDINKRANKKLKVENSLRRAVARGELVVYYQPKVDINTGLMSGMEALVRWQHPEFGLISPDEFIPLAESSGLIGDITDCVMTIVCSQLNIWQAAGYPLTPVSVNLSPVEFLDDKLARKVIAMIRGAGLRPGSVELEITENAFFDDINAAVTITKEFNDAGISLALDDFGTGYCSYNYLKQLPVDKLKIDRAFITNFTENITDAAIVNSMITLGKNLGFQVIAEGVETEAQLQFLRDLQCDQVQGYIISKPLPGDEVTKLLSDPSIIRRKIIVSMESAGRNIMLTDMPVASELIGMLNNV